MPAAATYRRTLAAPSPTISTPRRVGGMCRAAEGGATRARNHAPEASPSSGSHQLASPSGISGSRKATLRWTGPGSGGPAARWQARHTSDRQ